MEPVILAIQTIIVGITAWIVWRYTRETQRLREVAQNQVEVSQQQLNATQKQIEAMQRPFIVVDAERREGGRLYLLNFRNIGNSAAVNVEGIYGQYNVKIPIIESQENVSVDVHQVDSPVSLGDAVEETLEIRKESKYEFPLDAASITGGFILKIEYCNVAMMQYHTTQKVLPERVIIESSEKMGPDNPYT